MWQTCKRDYFSISWAYKDYPQFYPYFCSSLQVKLIAQRFRSHLNSFLCRFQMLTDSITPLSRDACAGQFLNIKTSIGVAS